MKDVVFDFGTFSNIKSWQSVYSQCNKATVTDRNEAEGLP
jgi:hypothetical protein